MKKNTTFGLMLMLIVLLLAAVIVLATVLVGMLQKEDAGAEPTVPTTTEQTSDETESPTETQGLPVVTQYMILSYPADMAQWVQIRYEDLTDGQQILFVTDFTGEELELFRFSISRSGTEGYVLGSLQVENVGDMLVCVQVTEYLSGNWLPEQYSQLNALQERVNDIIAQIYEDSRFTPAG